MLDARASGWLAYLAPGLVITILFEFLATGPLQRWSYAQDMPVLPITGTALLPLLQWVLVPALALWLTRRHVLGRPQRA